MLWGMANKVLCEQEVSQFPQFNQPPNWSHIMLKKGNKKKQHDTPTRLNKDRL